MTLNFSQKSNGYLVKTSCHCHKNFQLLTVKLRFFLVFKEKQLLKVKDSSDSYTHSRTKLLNEICNILESFHFPDLFIASK
jgi:uncharacterized protein YjhX (UPF0386 family)